MTPPDQSKPLSPNQERALTALRAAGGRATTYDMEQRGIIAKGAGRGIGRALGALQRRGLVDGHQQSVESAYSSMVWWVVEPRSSDEDGAA